MLSILSLGGPEKSLGYILPAEQLVQFMAANSSKFKTLFITQFTQQGKRDSLEGQSFEMFREQIWMQAPGRFYSRVLNEDRGRREVPDVAFRRLLLTGSPESFMQLLLEMGINLEVVALTRIDGIIAYRIGDAAPGSPKILIEKERFLPLQLAYWSIGDRAGALIEVKFKDYRKVDRGWYPFEITHASERWPNETYTILTILPNTPFDPSVFSSPMSGATPGQSPIEDVGLSDKERLRQIIKKFEEKYQ